MRAIIQFVLLLFSTSLALSATPTIPYRHLSHRGLPGAFYACPLPYWRSTTDLPCIWQEARNCNSRDAGTFPSFTPKSLGPDEYGRCHLYSSSNCTGELIDYMVFPGQADVAAAMEINSVWCYKCRKWDCSDISPTSFSITPKKPRPTHSFEG